MDNNDIKFNTKELMRIFNIQPVKSLGQNFLHDFNIVEKIVLSTGVTQEDTVIEVGPGLGVMTQCLAKIAKKVIVVEIDKKLIPVLEYIKSRYGNIEIIHSDILKLDNKKDILDPYCSGNVKVVANLPYYITTPIIMKFLEEDLDQIESLTFLVQKEVAERMTAKPGGKEYGSLSVAVGYFAEGKILFNVPPTVFTPKPEVDSSVIELKIRKESPYYLKDKAFFFKIVKAAFSQRRKTLANSIANNSYLGLSREDVYSALEKMGKDSNIRGETLSGEEFALLSNHLFKA